MQPLMCIASRPLLIPSSATILRTASPLSRAPICPQPTYAQRRAYSDNKNNSNNNNNNNNNNNSQHPYDNDSDLPFVEIPAHLRPKPPPPAPQPEASPTSEFTPPPPEPLEPTKDGIERAECEMSHPELLPSSAEGQRFQAVKRFSHLMDHLQSNIFVASKRINDLTGYSGIEVLKNDIIAMEANVSATQEAVRLARLVYKTTVADRASSQREVTALLARKDTWSPTDLERFTSLYRSDHGNEQAVQESATRLADAEREAERAASKLSSSILARYHEEQIWSDKIRRMSTWGTWGLMGVNVLLFLVFQLGFEPWRRKRLVAGFETKVREALVQEKMAHAGMSEEKAREATPEAEAEATLEGIVAAGILEMEERDSAAASPPAANDAAIAEGATGTPEAADIDAPGTPRGAAREALLDAQEQTRMRHAALLPAALTDWRDVEAWKAAVRELFSERSVSVRQADLTLIALEGVAAGAAFVGLLATAVFFRRS